VHAGDVVTLTDDNFDQQLAAHSTEPWFIAIGAPWCPRKHLADGAFAAACHMLHSRRLTDDCAPGADCRELEPTWQTLAGRLKGDVHVAKVN